MKPRAAILLLLAVAAPVAALLCAWRLAPPILNTDSATGFLAWESMRAGGPWNSVLAPDPADLARDHAEFVTWWSPGQYVFPGLVRALGFTWSHAAVLVTFISVLLGVLGVWNLGKRVGLDSEQTALACLLVSGTGGALHGFGMFWGGDILLLAAAPFVYLSAIRVRDLPPTSGATRFFFVCLAALFCKHGATVVIAGALLFLAGEALREHGPRLLRESRLWLAGGAALLAFMLSRLLWVRGGPTPADAGQVTHAMPAALGFALNGPWFSLTGAGSLCYWFFQRIHPAEASFQHPFSWWLLPPGLVMLTFVVWLGVRRDASRPWRLAAAAWLASSGLMAFLYFRGASVSLEERHFGPAVAPLALGLACVALPSRGRRALPGHVALVCLVGALALSGAAHIRRVELLGRLPKGSVTGFAQPDMPVNAWESVARGLPAGTTLVLTSPSHALEFPDRRILATDAFSRTKEGFALWRFAGGMPLRMALAAPQSFDADGRGAMLRAAFHDIEPAAWRRHEAAGWSLWLASGDSPGSGP